VVKIYLAARWALREHLLPQVAEIEARGHLCTSRWITEVAPETPPAIAARIDLTNIHGSDVLILLADEPDCDDPNAISGGRHFESGYACALGLRVFVVGRPQNVFHHDHRVRVVATLEEALDAL
jgi:nucleoside 2-deoxyribosyltransferase